MKRIGKEKLIDMLKRGYFVRWYEWFSLYGNSIRVLDIEGKHIGYITFDCWCKVFREGIIDPYTVQTHSYTDYFIDPLTSR